MTVILDLFKWAWKLFWPLIVLFMLIGVHLGVITYMDFDSTFINKIISLITQIFGGFFILYSINSNLEIFRNKNLWSLFVDRLNGHPIKCPNNKNKPIIINGIPASLTMSGLKGEVSLTNDSQSCDEKIEDIQKKN